MPRDPLTLTDRQGRPLYRRNRKGVLMRTRRPGKQLMRAMQVHVYERDQFTCRACGYTSPADEIASFRAGWPPPARLVLDHRKPYREGGTFTKWNLHTLCETCNARRGAMPWKAFLANLEAPTSARMMPQPLPLKPQPKGHHAFSLNTGTGTRTPTGTGTAPEHFPTGTWATHSPTAVVQGRGHIPTPTHVPNARGPR